MPMKGTMSELTLVLGPKNYSSWSMRAWLLLRWLDVSFTEVTVPLYEKGSKELLLRFSPAAKVPVLLDGDLTIWDSFAILSHLAEGYPHIWPADRAKRAQARSICAEMHSGFQDLRNAMPFNARARGRRVPITAAVARDIERIGAIWGESRRRFGADGPWLLGEFGVADIMFAPPAVRFRTYGVALEGETSAYSRRILDHPLIAEWFSLGASDSVIAACEVGGASA